MPRNVRRNDLDLVVDIVRQSTDGARRSDIAKALKDVPQRTLQYWLKTLVDDQRLTEEGKGPAARYLLRGAIVKPEETVTAQAGSDEEKPEEEVVPLSAESKKIRVHPSPSVDLKSEKTFSDLLPIF